MRRYPELLPVWQGRWKDLACVVRARDGTWGFGLGGFSPPAASVINDHLGPLITGQNCIEWFLELGFRAIKVFFRHGPSDDMEGLRRNEELVARARELIGDERELMVDAWMSFDVEYVVRLFEALRPYRIKWFEDCLRPEDLDSYARLRQRIPHQILAAGEHWYSIPPFAFAAARGLVDIFQPDIRWVAMPAIAWGERSEGVSPPGVPLAEMVRLPGTAVIENGDLVPSEAPGFGLEITREWLEERAA
jgi:L-rhamnonate dehydratase